jgi:hypothetical protein
MQRQTQFYFLLIISILFIFSCSKDNNSKSNQDGYIIPAKYISVKNFGVIGDGKSDETAAFAKAQDYAYANKIALLIPNGYYRINLELKYDSLYIFGENKPITRSDSLVNGTVIIGTINSKNKKFIQIENLGVWSHSDAIITGDELGNKPLYQKYLNLELLGTGYFGYKHGLLCQSGSNINIENITVTSFFHGIAIRTSNVNIKNTIANKCGFTSIVVKSAMGGNEFAQNVKIEDVIINGDSTDVYSRGGTILVQSFDDNCYTKNITINNVKSYHGGVATILIEQRKGKVDSVNINNCYSYKSGDNPIRATFDVLGAASNIYFNNCNSSFSNAIGYRTTKDAINIRVIKSFENGSKVAPYEGPFKFLELNNNILIQ